MRIHHPLNGPRHEDGAVAIMVAIFSLVLIVVAAFTTDFGMAYAQRQALATAADSSALAVIHDRYVAAKKDPTLTCEKLKVMPGLDAMVSEQVTANAPFGATDVAIVTTMDCVDAGNLQVKVVVSRTIKPILGSALGASPMVVRREAVAVLGIESTVGGLAPIALCTNQYAAILAQHTADLASDPPKLPPNDTAVVVPSDKVWKSGGVCDTGDTKPTATGAGNWGWLNFAGGKGTIGEPELAASIVAENGTITLGSGSPPSVTVNGVPGDRGSGDAVGTAMQGLLGKVITLPIYDSMTGSGSGATFNVTGFLSVRLCAFDKTSKTNPLGACADPSLTMDKNDMQVRFVSFTAVGDFGKVCGLGGTCSSNPDLLTTRLVQVDGSNA